MTNSDTENTLEPEEVNQRAIDTEPGDSLILNDRTVPLKVTGSHISESTESYWEDQIVVELSGNKTEYHLICEEGGAHGPMLYKMSEWDKTENELGETEYQYRRGERVTYVEHL